jgi:cytosine/adenosine deaminase-related metal-dependent hydrolase
LPDESGAVFHQHQNFMAADAAYDRERFGKPTLVYFAEEGLIGRESVFTHMNVLTDAEVDAVVDSGMALVWHPGNFMYYGIAQQAGAAFRKCTGAARCCLRHRRGQGLGVRRARL